MCKQMDIYRKMFDETVEKSSQQNYKVNIDTLKSVTLKQIEEIWAFWINDTKSLIEDAVKDIEGEDEENRKRRLP